MNGCPSNEPALGSRQSRSAPTIRGVSAWVYVTVPIKVIPERPTMHRPARSRQTTPSSLHHNVLRQELGTRGRGQACMHGMRIKMHTGEEELE